MTTKMSNSFRSQRPGIHAQDLIKLNNSVVKNGMLRLRRKLHLGKWPHRFIVLTHDSLYVYKDETSKAPHSIIALLGYNRVARCEVKGQDWCFSIIPEPNMKSIKTKTIACSSDGERKSWMQAIKSRIYVANSIPRPILTVLDKIKMMTGEVNEDDYATIEQAVFGTNSNETGEDKDLHTDGQDYDSSVESDSEIDLNVKKTTRSMSLPHPSSISTDSKESKFASRNRTLTDYTNNFRSSEYETSEEIYDSVDEAQESTRRLSSDVQPRIPLDSSKQPSEDTQRPASDPIQNPPPRYSEVYREESAYVNLLTAAKEFKDSLESAAKPSLESLCTVPDTQIDRKYLIDLLLETDIPGTYLIRKSRSDSNKVLVFLDADYQVKEYKLFVTPDGVNVDEETYFACIDELLEHYSSVEPLLNAGCFLKSGFYKVKGEMGI